MLFAPGYGVRASSMPCRTSHMLSWLGLKEEYCMHPSVGLKE